MNLRIQDLKPPPDDASHEEQLVGLVLRGVARGAAPPVGVVVRDEVVHLIDVRPAAAQKVAVGRLLAGLTQARFDDAPDRPQAVGVLGTFRLKQRPDEAGAPLVQVFLEWPDCSWWHWRALLDADGEVVQDTVTVQSARDGDPLPKGLGRWWSTARRHNLQLHLRRQAPAPPPLSSTLVN